MIKTKRLNIIDLKPNDVMDIHRLHSLDEVNQFNTINLPIHISETEKLLSNVLDENNNSSLGWSIRLQDDNTFIGEIGMNLSSPKFKMAEIYYSILPKYWGKGYTTEAVRGIILFCFNTLQLHRIEAGVATENLASIRVLEKVGMTREGRKRKVLPIRGEWVDNFHYAILDEDK